MATRRKPKKSRRETKKKNPSAPKRGADGRFLSKQSKQPKQSKSKPRGPKGRFLSATDKEYAKKEVALWDLPPINPIQERLARTRTKRGTGRAHLRKEYKGKARVELKEAFTLPDGSNAEKLVLRVVGDSEKGRAAIKDFLKKHGTDTTTRSWVNIGTKQTKGGFYGQSKPGTATQTYSYIETGSKEYGKRIGITPGQKLIFEIVIIRKR